MKAIALGTAVRDRAAAWWVIRVTALEERFVYRGDFALGTLMRFLPIITQIFLWSAVFSAASGVHIAGYDFREVVAYYLLTMLSRAFSSMPALASGIATQIRTGEAKKFLIQPVDMLGFLFLGRVAHKLAYYTVAIVPFALVFYACRSFFPGWPDAEVLAAYVLTLILGFLLGFFLESCIGLIGFWFLEVTSLLFIYMLLSFFLSGHMFPLDMLPAPWNRLVHYLPLKYLAYFPGAVFLGKVPRGRLWIEVAIEAAWVIFFLALGRVLWWRGTRRYSGYGG